MGRLTYKNVFSKYEKPFSHELSKKAYSIYKKIIRFRLAKGLPLNANEIYILKEDNSYIDDSSDMPKGSGDSEQSEVDGVIELKYLDLFDYLPKEEFDGFRKKLRHFAKKNKNPRFSRYVAEDDNRIIDFGRYVDDMDSLNLLTVEFAKNKKTSKYLPQVSVSIWNLSLSFLVIKYRFYLSSAFNEELNHIFKCKYKPLSDVARQPNVPWYKPWKFDEITFNGDVARYNASQSKLSELKWAAFCEIKRWFNVHLADCELFPPTFETYATNICFTPESEHLEFWNSVGLAYYSDYSNFYNAWVSWKKDERTKEGLSLKVFYVDKLSDYQSICVGLNLSDEFSVYMVANCLERIAERDIAVCNKKISKAIRKAKPSKLLKVRSAVRRKLYYCYRFASEFTGDSVGFRVKTDFVNPESGASSIIEYDIKDITSKVSEMKQRIDNIVKLLDNAAEYESAKANMTLQWFMAFITLISLVVAALALTNFTIDFSAIWKAIKALFN